MALRKRMRRGAYKSMRKRSRRFRPGSGRKLRYARFSRRSYTPAALMPESKYVDAAYGYAYATANSITPAVGSATLVLDGNGPATAAADTNAGGPGVVGIAGGSGFSNRIGRKILLKYMSVRMRIYWSQLTVGVAIGCPLIGRVRTLLFYDRQPNLALPLAADVMNVNAGLTIETFQEDKNRDRFVRLLDMTTQVSANTTTSANENSEVTVNKVVKVGGIQVYNDTALGGVANIQTGSLVWVFLWDLPGTGVAATTPPVIDLSTRLRFSDL